MPGDVLKINPKASSAINPSSVAPVPQPEPTLPYVHIHAANEN